MFGLLGRFSACRAWGVDPAGTRPVAAVPPQAAAHAPARQPDPRPAPPPTSDSLSLSDAATTHQPNAFVRAKKAIIRGAVNLFGGGDETAKQVSEINPYDIAVKAGKGLGLSDQRAHRVAANAMNPSYMRWLAGVGSAGVRLVPQLVVNRTIANGIERQVAAVLPKGRETVALSTGVGRRSSRALARGIEAGQNGARAVLSKQGKLDRAIKLAHPAPDGILRVVRSKGVWRGTWTIVQGKVQRAKDAIGLVRTEGVRALAGKPTLDAIREEGHVWSGMKRALRDNYARNVETSLEKGIERGGERVLQRLTNGGIIYTATKGEAQVLSRGVAQATKRGILEATGKGAVGMGVRVAGLMPVVGALAEGAILAYDGTIAYDIHHDPKASRSSALLADVTVGLDGVATGSVATGWLTPVGWGASAASLVTGIARDLTR